MKKILFISINDHVPWGGSEVLWSETAKELSTKYHVSALVKKWSSEPDPIKELKRNKVSVFYKIERVTKSYKIKKLKKLLGFKHRSNHHLNQNGLSKPDLVVISLGNHLDINVFNYTDYLNTINVDYVVVFQLVTDLRGLIDADIQKFKRAYLKAKKLYFLSKDNVEKAEMFFSVNFSNKDYINNPFNYRSNYIAIRNNEIMSLGCVAALNSFHKGLDIFLKTLAQDKWKNRAIVINIYGNGHNKNQLEELIKLYGIEDKINLVGFVSNKEEIWEQNYGLILPSRMEGQSLAMLEAMSCGRMVIATDVGDANRLVIDNKTGFLIEAPTVKNIDEALEKAWSKRENWIEYGKNARKHLFDTISKEPVEDFANKLKELI